MMDDNALRTLALAFSRHLVAPPGPGRRFAFFNAGPIPDAPPGWRLALHCEQGFRPDYLDLVEQGYDVVPLFGGDKESRPGGMDGAIVLAGRLRLANEIAVARAWSMVGEGGQVLVAGANTDGIQSLRKWVSRFATLDESLSKYHSVVFVFTREGGNPFPADRIDPPRLVSPAMFSAAGTDPGSKLLAGDIDARICGRVADFGAGSGYLCRQLIERGGAIVGLDAYEADYLSLQAARSDLAVLGTKVELRFFWHDLLREPPQHRYDWVVMNPPFHAGRAALPQIGMGFIAAAARVLRPGGRLLMVSNRNLPYEPALESHFRRFEKRAEDGTYKVHEAIR